MDLCLFAPVAIGFAAIVGVMTGGGVATAAPLSRIELCALATKLGAVILAKTDYDTAPECPGIGFGVLTGDAVQRSQAGGYYPATGEIELAPDLDLTTTYGQSYLLHELVHAAQYRAGRQNAVACPAALEAEAYGVQSAFLRDHGLGRDAMMTALLAGQIGGCSEPDY